MSRFFAFILLCLLLCLPTAAQETSRSVGVLHPVEISDEAQGMYVLYSPTDLAPETPAPLLMVLHGRMSNIRAMEAISHLNPQADALGFRVAYVQAGEYSWQDGWKEAGVPRYESGEVDDFGLLTAVEADIAAQVTVNDLYYVGFDTGGHMALSVLCQRSETLAGVVLVSSLPWSYWPNNCPETLSAGRVLIIHGDMDTTHQPNGFESSEITLTDGSQLRQLGREELLNFFIERSGCVDAEAVEQLRVLTDCADGGTVSLVNIPAGGHEWFRAGEYFINQEEADAGALIGQWVNDTLTEVTLLTRAPEKSVARTHQLFVPSSYDATQPIPLVIGLHGKTDTGAGFALITEMDKVAEAEGFAVVFPDGLLNQWNYLGDFVNADLFHYPDDIEYLELLIQDIAVDVNIDPQRVYLMGFSNGGFMTYRVGCEVSHPFAGFGVVSALMYPEFEITCPYARPTPIVIIHGTQDNNILWDGVTHPSPDGTNNVFGTRSVLQSVGYWSARNQCVIDEGVKTEYEPQTDTETQVIRFDFENCVKDARVRFFAIVSGGHTWPGSQRLSASFGRTAMDISGAQEIWDFLSQFHRDDL